MSRVVSDLTVAVATIFFASAYLIGTYDIRTLVVADPLGPKAVPALLGVMLLLCGISLAVTALRRHCEFVSRVAHR